MFAITPRVLISLSLLGGAKVLNVCVPFLFKMGVDNLSTLSMDTVPEAAASMTIAVLLGCKPISITLSKGKDYSK